MKKNYLKEIPRALLIGLSVFIVMLLIELINGNINFDSSFAFGYSIGKLIASRFLYTMLYSISIHFANTFLFDLLDNYFKSKRYTIKRLIVGFVSSFILTILVIFLLRIFEDVIIEHESFFEFFKTEKAANYIAASIISFVIILIIHLVHFYKALQENKLDQQKVIAGTASAKFESLKNQIDPHFLFNSLNVLSALIEENPENAQRFTTSLSKVYRYVLEQKDKELILVADEISFAKTYMNLLKMRFENSLSYEINIETLDSEAKVVPLSLQLLLENTVKHNIVSEQKPLQIRIYLENNYLCVQNDYQKKDALSDRQGVGLQNIINRYDIITNRKVLIDQTAKTFTVKIPILTKQISIMETQNNYSENTAYYRAKKRVEELKGFYGNLTSYCIVIPILAFINLNYGSKSLWFFFPMLGWGIGLTFHAMGVFGYSKSWEEKKINELMSKEKQTNKYQ